MFGLSWLAAKAKFHVLADIVVLFWSVSETKRVKYCLVLLEIADRDFVVCAVPMVVFIVRLTVNASTGEVGAPNADCDVDGNVPVTVLVAL